MRAHEFIGESTPTGTIRRGIKRASNGIIKMRDVGGYDRVYHLNRIMMATAIADGESTDAVDMDSASWYEKYNTAHPYTEKEHTMIRAAMNTIPTDKEIVAKYQKSTEPRGGNTTSPVPKR
jgi:hypothetical protein